MKASERFKISFKKGTVSNIEKETPRIRRSRMDEPPVIEGEHEKRGGRAEARRIRDGRGDPQVAAGPPHCVACCEKTGYETVPSWKRSWKRRPDNGGVPASASSEERSVDAEVPTDPAAGGNAPSGSVPAGWKSALIAFLLPTLLITSSDPAVSKARAGERSVSLSECAAAYRAKRYERAFQCFDELMEKKGPLTELLYAKAYCAYQLKRYRTASRLFSLVAQANPKDGDALFMQGMSELRQDEYERAIELLKRALKVGLREEDPKEARKMIRLMRQLLRPGTKKGWHLRVEAMAGYDSHPRISGSASEARTDTRIPSEGSAIASADLGVGYRFEVTPTLTGDASYRFTQLAVFSDLDESSGGRGMHGQTEEDLPPLSLQTHRLGYKQSYDRGKLSASILVQSVAELYGLRSLSPFVISGIVQPDASYEWAGFASSTLRLRYTPQRSLQHDYAFLSGNGLYLWIVQSLWWKRWVHVELGYRLHAWWLGTLRNDSAGCVPTEPCVLEAPYSSIAHEALLGAHFRPAEWVSIRADGSLQHRAFDGSSTYQLAGGQRVERRRKDLLQRYGLAATFRLASGLTLRVRYLYENNKSNITADETGIDQSYSRHIVEGGLRYLR